MKGNYMQKKTYYRYVALVQSKVWKEADILAFKMMLNRAFNFGKTEACFDGRTRIQVGVELLEAVEHAEPYRISAEQTTKGLDWLRSKCFKRNGEIRDTKSRPFGYQECQKIAGKMRKFSHWTFDGFYRDDNGYGHSFFSPIYTMHAKDGKSFSYSVTGQGERVFL